MLNSVRPSRLQRFCSAYETVAVQIDRDGAKSPFPIVNFQSAQFPQH